jgi:serine/threonine protein kinase
MLHSSDRWKQIEDLFHVSLELPSESRSAFLDERCGIDTELRREVETLLDSAGKPMDVLQQSVADAAYNLIARRSATAIAPGKQIAHYEITSFLGSGGMGQVYLAVDTRLKRRVAIKILTSALTQDERALRRLEQEARAASGLNHPNILTIYEFGVVDELHYIASEYVEGLTLRQKLVGGKLALETALDIGLQIASALETAHTSGVVHRDVKPENVVVRNDGLLKVLDFGIAKLTEAHEEETVRPAPCAVPISVSQAGMVIGSARYMSPEQACGETVDARSDIFGLGVVLYE